MTETPIGIQLLTCRIRDDSRSHAEHLCCHLFQECLMPVFSCWLRPIHNRGNALKDPFQTAVEPMQIQRNAVQIVVIRGTLSTLPTLFHAIEHSCKVDELYTDASAQWAQLIVHSSTPPCAIFARSAGRQSPGSTRSTLMSALRPVTAATAA